MKIESVWLVTMLCALASCETSAKRTSVSSSDVQSSSARLAAEDEDENVPVNQLPAAVRDAALQALPGLVITEAERETEDGVVQYSIKGTVGTVTKEVEVSADGSKVKIEDDDEDDDDDDDDDG